MAAAQGSKARGRVVQFGLGDASGAGRGATQIECLKGTSTFWLCIRCSNRIQCPILLPVSGYHRRAAKARKASGRTRGDGVLVVAGLGGELDLHGGPVAAQQALDTASLVTRNWHRTTPVLLCL
jgi:hypothetical protein